MSGVDVSREQKESQVHVCASCMSTVVQSFSHFRERIEQLKQEKAKLEEACKKLREEQEEQKRAMLEEIRVLEEKLAALKKQ